MHAVQGRGAYLESSLVFFCVLGVDLLHGLHVVLQVTDGMFPCLKALSEQTGRLRKP
jgi:hypothetical protein